MGAKKGQPHRTYSKELKQILLSRMATEPYESLSREFGVSVKTMENWQYKYKKGTNIFDDARLKRPAETKKPTYEELEQEIDILKKMKIFANSQQSKK